jgi:hypothetical protein
MGVTLDGGAELLKPAEGRQTNLAPLEIGLGRVWGFPLAVTRSQALVVSGRMTYPIASPSDSSNPRLTASVAGS